MKVHKHLDDKDLVLLLVNDNNEDAFCELYIRYRKRMLSFCLTFIKIPEVAEDVVQEVFATIWSGRNCLNPEMSFSSYLYTITRNRMLNFLRQVSQDAKIKTRLQEAGHPAVNVTDVQILDNEYKEILEKAISQLSPLRQNIFRLSREENKSHKEIAQQLGISPYTVQENISAALKHIKTYLIHNAGLHFGLWLIFFNL